MNLRAFSGNRACGRTTELYERLAVNELKWLPSCKRQRIPGEAGRGHQDSPVCTFGRDNPKELSDPLDRYLPIEPVLALNDYSFAPAG